MVILPELGARGATDSTLALVLIGLVQARILRASAGK